MEREKTLEKLRADEEQCAAKGLEHLVRRKQDEHGRAGGYLGDMSALGLVLLGTDYRECLDVGKSLVRPQGGDGPGAKTATASWPGPGLSFYFLLPDECPIFDLDDRPAQVVDAEGHWIDAKPRSGRIEVPLWSLATPIGTGTLAEKDRVVIVIRRDATKTDVGLIGLVGRRDTKV